MSAWLYTSLQQNPLIRVVQLNYGTVVLIQPEATATESQQNTQPTT